MCTPKTSNIVDLFVDLFSVESDGEGSMLKLKWKDGHTDDQKTAQAISDISGGKLLSR